MVVPVGAPSFAEALRIGAEIYHTLKALLEERGLATGVGDEGGFAPDLDSSEAAIEADPRGDRARRLHPASEIALALDPATSELFADGLYRFGEGARARHRRDGRLSTRRSSSRYPIVSHRGRDGRGRLGRLEAPDRAARRPARSSSATTSSSRTSSASARASSESVANSILIKVNQIGTLTETLDAIALARTNGYTAVISHRSGETEDTTIADLAVATNAGQIKTGAPVRSDRMAKYNQLLRIEEELGSEGRYPGGVRSHDGSREADRALVGGAPFRRGLGRPRGERTASGFAA